MGSADTLPSGTVVISNPVKPIRSATAQLRETLRIGAATGDGPDVFGRIADFLVDEAGRIFVLDRLAYEIRIFNADGSHVRSVGREGGGPGEFQRPIGMDWGPAGELWVLDPGLARMSVFDTAGSFIASRPRPGGIIMDYWRGGFDERGSIYIVGARMRSQDYSERVLVRLDSTFLSGDTLPIPSYEQQWFTHPTSPSRLGVPFTPRMVYRFDRRGYLWFGISEEYRIYQRHLAGDTARVIGRDYDPVPVAPDERELSGHAVDWFLSIGGRIDPSRVPHHKPAFTDFVVDTDGRLWVEVPLPHGESGTALDIFDTNGRYVSRLRSDMQIRLAPPPVVRGDTVYAVVTDELDVPCVIRSVVKWSTNGEIR